MPCLDGDNRVFAANINRYIAQGKGFGSTGCKWNNNPEDTQKIEEEVKQLKHQLIQVANSTYSGRYIFSGFKTDQKLLNEDGSFAIEVINDVEKIVYEVDIEMIYV